MVPMAKQGSGAASKEEKKAAKQAAKAARRERFRQIWQAFQMQRREDKALLPIMIGTVIGTALVLFLVGLLIGQEWFLLPTGILPEAHARIREHGLELPESMLEASKRQGGRHERA